jgi:hypothetical protein
MLQLRRTAKLRLRFSSSTFSLHLLSLSITFFFPSYMNCMQRPLTMTTIVTCNWKSAFRPVPSEFQSRPAGYKNHLSVNPFFYFFFASTSLFIFSIDISIVLRDKKENERRQTNGKAPLRSILFTSCYHDNSHLHNPFFFRP